MNKENINLLKVKFQQVGTMLSSMIMPIVGVIIAWGILTAFFIPTGWTPVKVISDNIVGPTIKYLIPILIGFLGGKQVYGLRGGFLGAAATMGIIGGAQIMESGFWGIKAKLGVQFLGAMIIGPLSGYLFKKVEVLWEGKVKPGFEMLVNNFSMGIAAVIMMLFGLFLLPWLIYSITFILNGIIDPLTKHKVLPIVSVLVEPAKPLFLNNAINHGIFTPLAINQVAETGKSILYYIESNPGPGMGILLAYMLMNKEQRGNAGSASVIHFFGGIHEVYFPFIIMKPILVIAAIVGGTVGVAILQMFSVGAIAPASPGSIIALFAVSAKGPLNYIGLTLAIFGSLGASFVTSIFLLKFSKRKTIDKNEAILKMNFLKGKESKYIKTNKEFKKIIFACDAGMGSSAMGSGILRKIFKEKNINVEVTNKSIKNLKFEKTDLIIVHKDLSKRAQKENNAQQFLINNFLDKNQYYELINLYFPNSIKNHINEKIKTQKTNNFIFKDEMIIINSNEKSMEEAISKVGNLLYENKYVKKSYIKSMIDRNKDVSVYVGNGVAIPHGDSSSKDKIYKSGISLITYPKGINWNSEIVYLVIGIAGIGNQHMNFIRYIGEKLSKKENVDKIIKSTTKNKIKEIFNGK